MTLNNAPDKDATDLQQESTVLPKVINKAGSESKAQYRLRLFKEASFEKLDSVLTECSKRTGRSKAAMLRGIIHCFRKFGAGYYDYMIYHFYEKTDAELATYMTRLKNKRFNSYLNDSSYVHIFDNKHEFYNIFKDFLKRDYVDAINSSEKDIADILMCHDSVICKLPAESCSIGMQIYHQKDFKDPMDFAKMVKEKGYGVVEEVVVNHPDTAKVYPNSLNTIRIITIIDDNGKVHVPLAAQKFGNGGKFTDIGDLSDVNGMYAPVNIETGAIEMPLHDGYTIYDILYTEHPETHYKFTDFKIPLFQECKDLVAEMAPVVPQVRYVGWDVAVTPTGPIVVEGNIFPGYEFWQLPGQCPDGTGMIARVKDCLPGYDFDKWSL